MLVLYGTERGIKKLIKSLSFFKDKISFGVQQFAGVISKSPILFLFPKLFDDKRCPITNLQLFTNDLQFVFEKNKINSSSGGTNFKYVGVMSSKNILTTYAFKLDEF